MRMISIPSVPRRRIVAGVVTLGSFLFVVLGTMLWFRSSRVTSGFRVIEFPLHEANELQPRAGSLRAPPQGSPHDARWENFGRARGKVQIPQGMEVELHLPYGPNEELDLLKP